MKGSANYTSLQEKIVTYLLNFSSRLVEQRQHLEFSTRLPHNRLFGDLGFGKNI